MKYLFLDESGEHNLTKIDMQYPVFVLGGIVVDSEYLGKLDKKKLISLNLICLGTKTLSCIQLIFQEIKMVLKS